MPRIPRHLLHRPEGTYHIVMRGNDRSGIFHDDGDREALLELFAREIACGSFLLHHYVLMGNHLHAIVRLGPEGTLSEPMQRINQAYSLHHAARYGRTGHLWEDRFKSFLIDSDAYLLACGIYIGLNPVRAGIVADPNAYPWSSHRAYTSGSFDPLIAFDPAYLGLGNDARVRRDIYCSLAQSWLERGMDNRKAKAFFAKGPVGVLPPN